MMLCLGEHTDPFSPGSPSSPCKRKDTEIIVCLQKVASKVCSSNSDAAEKKTFALKGNQIFIHIIHLIDFFHILIIWQDLTPLQKMIIPHNNTFESSVLQTFQKYILIFVVSHWEAGFSPSTDKFCCRHENGAKSRCFSSRSLTSSPLSPGVPSAPAGP